MGVPYGVKKDKHCDLKFPLIYFKFGERNYVYALPFRIIWASSSIGKTHNYIKFLIHPYSCILAISKWGVEGLGQR